jgi:hypothetical protein
VWPKPRSEPALFIENIKDIHGMKMTLKILEETAMLVKEKMGQDYRDTAF